MIIIGSKITLYIEYVTHPIIFSQVSPWPKNKHVFGLDLGEIDMCGVKTETRCPLVLAVFFSFRNCIVKYTYDAIKSV